MIVLKRNSLLKKLYSTTYLEKCFINTLYTTDVHKTHCTNPAFRAPDSCSNHTI